MKFVILTSAVVTLAAAIKAATVAVGTPTSIRVVELLRGRCKRPGGSRDLGVRLAIGKCVNSNTLLDLQNTLSDC